ncbi:MAG: glycosyltransferase family 39 protein [Actinobacteria bacterium]|nr:glycosyltransferase family 39 protein [Actinomycetota bacterium]
MPNRLVAGNGGRLGIAALVAILLLGAGLRLGEAWSGRAPVFDAAAYAAIAKNLEEGDGFTVGAAATQPSTDYSPGLPLFVAGIYKVTGGVHERLARIVLALIGALAPLFAYLLARRLSPRHGITAGLIAALVVAIYPATLEYTGMLMTEPLAATLLIGGILGIVWAADRDSLRRWIVPGLTLGALALVRPEYLAIGLLLALIVFLRQRLHMPWRRAVGAAAIVALGIVLVVAPWTARNAFALHRFVSVSTGGGQVLFAGTYLPSDGNPEKVGAAVVAEHPLIFAPNAAENLRLEQILARLAEATYPGMEPDQALSKMGREQLKDDIEHHTGEYIGFVAAKIGRIWSHGPRAIMRTPVWEALHWVLLGLGLLGLGLLAYLRRWEALLIGAVFLAVTLVSALLVASPRRVLVLIPLLAACAGMAAVWLTAAIRRRGDQSVL